MEIKEAIEKLNNFKNYVNCGLLSNALLSDTQQAINTVLEELNNRIPREKVETIKQELEEKNLEIDFEWDSEDVKIAKYEDKAKLDLCKELLNKE